MARANECDFGSPITLEASLKRQLERYGTSLEMLNTDSNYTFLLSDLELLASCNDFNLLLLSARSSDDPLWKILPTKTTEVFEIDNFKKKTDFFKCFDFIMDLAHSKNTVRNIEILTPNYLYEVETDFGKLICESI